MKSGTKKIYYVYVLFRPNGLPCYVGKGQRNRWLDHERFGEDHYNKHLARIIKKAGGTLPRVKVRENLTTTEAMETEIALIKAIGRGKEGPLVNLTDGGEGSVGYSPTTETREKVRAIMTGRRLPKEVVAKMVAARLGGKRSAETKAKMRAAQIGKTLSPETRAKLSAARKGKTGFRHSEKTKALMREVRLAKPNMTQECRNKARLANLGRKHGEDQRRAHSARMKGNKNTLGHKLTQEHKEKVRKSLIGNTRCRGKTLGEETRAKISASLKRKAAINRSDQQLSLTYLDASAPQGI